jgi:predicted phosphodiesterase
MSPLAQTSVRRLGAIGDIHAEDELLSVALSHIASIGVDVVLAVGDVVDGRGDVNRCCRLLEEHRAITVAGNHDRWFLQDQCRDLTDATPRSVVGAQALAFLKALPATRQVDTVAGSLLLCHGLGDNDMATVTAHDTGYALESNLPLHRLLAPGGPRFVINGHSHQRMVRRFGDLTIMNAGTLFVQHDPCFFVADLEAGSVQFYDLDERQHVRPAEAHALGR